MHPAQGIGTGNFRRLKEKCELFVHFTVVFRRLNVMELVVRKMIKGWNF